MSDHLVYPAEHIAELLTEQDIIWTVNGKQIAITAPDVERLLKHAVRELGKQPEDNLKWSQGGLVIEKWGTVYDVYVHIETI